MIVGRWDTETVTGIICRIEMLVTPYLKPPSVTDAKREESYRTKM